MRLDLEETGRVFRASHHNIADSLGDPGGGIAGLVSSVQLSL